MTLKELSNSLNVPESWLLTVIEIESNNNPRAVNKTTGATGLIQFMPATARALGTSTAELLNMDYNTQLDYVYKYLKPYKRKIKSVTDLYLTVFYPAAVGKPLWYVIGSERSNDWARTIRRQNPSFTKNAVITKADIAEYVKKKYRRLGNNDIIYIFERLTKNI